MRIQRILSLVFLAALVCLLAPPAAEAGGVRAALVFSGVPAVAVSAVVPAVPPACQPACAAGAAVVPARAAGARIAVRPRAVVRAPLVRRGFFFRR